MARLIYVYIRPTLQGYNCRYQINTARMYIPDPQNHTNVCIFQTHMAKSVDIRPTWQESKYPRTTFYKYSFEVFPD